MGAITLAYRSELRRRWRSWLSIAVLVAVVGGVVLASVAAGRRTATAFPDFVTQHGYDVVMYGSTPLGHLKSLPGVIGYSEFVGPDSGQPRCDCTRQPPADDTSVVVLRGGTFAPTVLVSGRRPSLSDPHEVDVSFTMAQDFGVHIGSVITVPFFTPGQAAAANNEPVPPKPAGPTVSFRVVGFDASQLEFPFGGVPNYFLFASPAFTRDYEAHLATGYVYFVRLRGGAAGTPRFLAATDRLQSQGLEFATSVDGQLGAVESSIHPQAIGWWILAALAALVGLGVIGQALARQSGQEAEDYPTLSAVGMQRNQLFALATGRNLAVALVGALGAVGIATLLSPIAPLGEARIVIAGAWRFDPLVLPLGGLGVLAVVVLLGLVPAASTARQRPDRNVGHARSSVFAERLAAFGARPPMLVGVRSALERRRGSSSVPVGSAIVGTVLAVAGLCGTAVFGASLDHLVATPALYGDSFALNLSNGGNGTTPSSALVRSLKANPAVTAVTQGYSLPVVSIDHLPVGAVGTRPLKGAPLLSTVSGHVPDGPGQLGLGAKTMRELGVRVGSRVEVTIPGPSGGQRTTPYTVVGEISFPVLGQSVGLGSGAAFTLSSFFSSACGPGPREASCRHSAIANGGGLLVRVAPGPAGQAAVRHYLVTVGQNAAIPVVPTSLINFGQAVNFPALFGVMLAIFGAATLLHMLVVSVARRRRDVGLLKVVGFVNGQVASSVGWQASTLAIIGIVIGVPAGIAAGAAVWRAFAGNLGVVPVSVVPVWLIVVLAAGVAIVANLMAVGPALVARRARPSDLLRAVG